MVGEADRWQSAREKSSLVSIIDDDESVREAIAGLMNWLGLRVQVFSSAIEFLAFPEFGKSSCVIADVQMPHMSGIELHSRLMQLGYCIPTILITAYPSDEARARALGDGVLCYLSKPFDKDALIGCVHTALNLQRG